MSCWGSAPYLRGHGGGLGGGGGPGVQRGGVQREGGDGERSAGGGDLRHEDRRPVEGRVRPGLYVDRPHQGLV